MLALQFAQLRDRQGFTIVELLIVIVVIALLAAISVVAYNGIQLRARDTIRKQDLTAAAKALSLYNVDKGNFVASGSGCGAYNNGEGWFSHRSSLGGASSNPRSVTDCLIVGKYLDRVLVGPSGCTDNARMVRCGIPATAYMKINCSSDGQQFAYLMARLEGESTLNRRT